MSTKQKIGSALGGVVLAWLTLTSAGCLAEPAEGEGQAPGQALGQAQQAELFCPTKWACSTTDDYYGTKAGCLAACGGTGCYRDADCSLKDCICP